MTAVLWLSDDTFEDGQTYVVADSMAELAPVAAAYLRAAAPVLPMTGTRIEVPEVEPIEGWLRWTQNVADDLDDISIEFFSSEEREVRSPEEMEAWISFHAVQLRRQHAPMVQTIVTDLL